MKYFQYFNNFINQLKKRENIFSFVLIIIIFFLDRCSKIIIIRDFKDNSYFFNEYLNLDLIWNSGIGFGLFSAASDLIYNFITTIIAIVIFYLIYISLLSKKIDKLIYCIIIGGAVGNFYDRIIYKSVPDFIDIHYGNVHWFTFNVADIFITIGIILFMFKSFFYKS